MAYLGPSYEDLPMEIILQIMGYLHPSDVLEASLTCRRWFEASLHPIFTSKIQIVFSRVQLNDPNDRTSPLNVFANSFRSYKTIQLDQVDFGQTDDFWNRLGEQFTAITFNSCDLREKTFNAILKQLTNLQSLEINNCRELFMSGRLFKNPYDKEAICMACVNVRDISLCNNRYLSDALFSRIVAAMKNIQSLNLSGCHISFHNGLYRKFYPDFQHDASESVLTFYYILQFIEFQAMHLKCLNFSGTLIDGSALGKLAQISNLQLERLHLRSCDQLTNSGISTFVRFQSSLVELDLSMSVRLVDPGLIEICQSLTQLKVLKLRRCRAITDLGIKEVRHLKHLEILDISECNAITSDGFINGIVQTSNLKLIELHVSALNICELAIIRIAECLDNLLLLDLSFCKNAVTDLALQLIFKHLTKLRTLNLEFCDKISDAGITGMEMFSKLDKYEKAKEALNKKMEQSSEAGTSYEVDNQADDSHDERDGGAAAAAAYQNNDQIHQLAVEALRRDLEVGHQATNRHPYQISLRSKAEEDIVNDAKRKKIMFKMCEQTINKEEINCSNYSIARLKGLRTLNLTSCNRITDVSLKYAFDFIELKYLSLSKCQQISSIGIECFLPKCPSLADVNLSECHNLTDKAIEAITLQLKRLTYLHIERCSQLTDHSLDYIGLNCKRIKYLDVRSCRSMCSEPNLRLEHIRSLQRIVMSKPGPYLPAFYETTVKQPKAPPLPSSF